MTSFRRFTCDDLLSFSNVNLDKYTETYNFGFYMTYMDRWPEYFTVAQDITGRQMGYIMGKVEGKGDQWHGHVTAVTVAPEARRLGLAKNLMGILEGVTDKVHHGYFVDLFVRQSNEAGLAMYNSLGYIKYRRILGYYHDRNSKEDAFDMHKAMSRDTEKKSMIAIKRPVREDEID